MLKPIIIICEDLSPATISVLGEEFDIRHIDGTDRKKLLLSVQEASAIIIRSATQIDTEVITAAPNLKIIARAGVGLDNVDIHAATQAGVMVANAPTSNIISAAELTVAHILNLARNIPQAHISLRDKKWLRSKFVGIELYEKTVGIIGLGRIGSLVAARLQSFGMKVVAYDPYVALLKAAQLDVELLTLDELYSRAHFITIHMPKTPETTGMIGEEAIRKMKQFPYIINVARGGLIDEKALYRALKAKKISGAAIDVYEQEPCIDSPLFTLDNVVSTPHLGASTHEAQEKAGISVAKSVVSALSGDLIPDAVNAPGGIVAEEVKHYINLAEKLGHIFTVISQGSPLTLDVIISGDMVDKDTTILEFSVLKGLLSSIVSGQVSYVNARDLANKRGINSRLLVEKSASIGEYRNLIRVVGSFHEGHKISLAATITNISNIEKLVHINGYDIEIPITEHIMILLYQDTPGVVGKIGKILGQNYINIANMQVSRNNLGGDALAVMAIDASVSKDVVDEIILETKAKSANILDL